MHRQALPYASCLLILTLLQACDFYGGYENRYNGNVEGIIMDHETGEVLEGVVVYYDYYNDAYQNRPGDYYYDYPFVDSTVSDADGKFLIRNLEEQWPYIVVLRKWPGYEQLEEVITTTPGKTDQYELHLDSASAALSIEPEDLEFTGDTSSLYFVLINEGSIPFNYTLDSQDPWIHLRSDSGTLDVGEAEVLYVDLSRGAVGDLPATGQIRLTILSTGAVSTIPVYVAQ